MGITRSKVFFFFFFFLGGGWNFLDYLGIDLCKFPLGEFGFLYIVVFSVFFWGLGHLDRVPNLVEGIAASS